jgi:hypothetical protein
MEAGSLMSIATPPVRFPPGPRRLCVWPRTSPRRSSERSATALMKARMMPSPMKLYRMVKTLPAAVDGERSPWPTVVRVTTLKYSEPRKPHPSICR